VAPGGAIVQVGEVLGMNVMYLDGHAQWVRADKIKVRYNSNGFGLLW
jgi:prepilin-type processing-associated H-X9-DG protein